VGDRPAEEERTPFVFRLAVVLAVLYLVVRLIQGVIWVWERVL
jgi:hypothetical protein